MKPNKLLISFFFLLFLGGFFPALAQDSGKAKHIILVMDTSLSVSWNNVVEPMQAVIKEVLSRKKTDDIVSILTFNSGVLKRVDRSEEDIEYLLKKTENYSPEGGWTFTAAMLKKLVQEISREGNKSYAQSIFIISDGLDDPPTKNTIELDVFQGKANVFYIRPLTEDRTQEKLIKQVFPQVSVKVIDVDNPLSIQQSLALLDDDFTLKGVVLQFPIDFNLIANRKKESFKVQILANARLAGREFVFKAEAENPMFRQQIGEEKKDQKQDFRLQSSIKRNIQLQEGSNSFTIPYFIPATEAGKVYNVVFSLALAQDSANPLLAKNTQLTVESLSFFEKFSRLPIVYFVLMLYWVSHSSFLLTRLSDIYLSLL